MNNERIDLTRLIALADKMAAAHDEMGLEGMGIHHVEAHSALLESISELKRCYEKLDEAKQVEEALWGVLDNWEICWDDYSMHNLYNELDEKYAQDDDGRIVLKELYSYTEEDGWQPKEYASQ
tara:strand:+ start:197 stop:565 length:369 start_codon:yes stop_codon:yes gene_type:complete